MVVFLYRLTDGNEYLFQAKDDVSLFLSLFIAHVISVMYSRKRIAAKSSGMHVSAWSAVWCTRVCNT